MFSKWLIAVLLLCTSIAALAGVYQTHIISSSDGVRLALQFGSTSGSLAIVAFTLSVMAWGKQVMSCMSKCEVC